MNNNLINLILGGALVLGLITIVLAAARRRFAEHGYNVAAAFMSVIWSGAIAGAFALLAFFITSSTYGAWFPAEPLERSKVIGGWFSGSGLNLSDLMALTFTVLAFGLAHLVAFSGMLLRQNFVQAFSKAQPTVKIDINYGEMAWDTVGFVMLFSLFWFFMTRWEAPILALRCGELIGSESLEKQLNDIGSIESVGQIVGSSWVLNTVQILWPTLILLVSWGFTRAWLGLAEAINPQDNKPQDNKPAEESGSAQPDQGLETETTPSPAAPGGNVPDARRVPMEQAEAHRQVADAERRAAEAEARADAEMKVSARRHTDPGNGNGASTNGTTPATGGATTATMAGAEHVQALIDQVEEERARNSHLQRENAALSQQHSFNPLWQPNRAGAPDQLLDRSHYKGDFHE
jgi:hypothetical protein